MILEGFSLLCSYTTVKEIFVSKVINQSIIPITCDSSATMVVLFASIICGNDA